LHFVLVVVRCLTSCYGVGWVRLQGMDINHSRFRLGAQVGLNNVADFSSANILSQFKRLFRSELNDYSSFPVNAASTASAISPNVSNLHVYATLP